MSESMRNGLSVPRWMTEGMIPQHGLLKKFSYREETLLARLNDVIDWAENRIEKNINTNKESLKPNSFQSPPHRRRTPYTFGHSA